MKQKLSALARSNKRIRDKQWHKDHPEAVIIARKRYNLKAIQRRYGITLDEYQEILDLQGGGCAICFRPPKSRKLSVDHDHKTGRIRGLLCWTCNYALGMFRDSSARLSRASQYLQLAGD